MIPNSDVCLPLGLASTEGLGVAVCQRLEHICTSLGNRNLGELDALIAAPTVPRLRDAVGPRSVLERVVAFGVVRVDRPPRGQDEDLETVSGRG
jgi:hypothetical protein